MLIADRIRINYLLEFGTTSNCEDEFIFDLSQLSNISDKQRLKLVEVYDKVRYDAYAVTINSDGRRQFITHEESIALFIEVHNED